MQAAHKAFAGLTFTGTDHNQWLVHFRDRTTYWKSQDELKRDQLAKGGARLAQLLNTIWPSPVAAAPLENVTACTAINVCYCITASHRDAIATNVVRIRQLIADQLA